MSWNPPEIWGWTDGMLIPVTDSAGRIVQWATPDEGIPDSWGFLIWIVVITTILSFYILVVVPIIAIWNVFICLIRRDYVKAFGYFMIPVIYALIFGGFKFSTYADDNLICRQVRVWATEENSIFIETHGPKHVGISINGSVPKKYNVGSEGNEVIGIHVQGELHSVEFAWVWNLETTVGHSIEEKCNQKIVSDGQFVSESALRPSLDTVRKDVATYLRIQWYETKQSWK
jgi:hypothetical protein